MKTSTRYLLGLCIVAIAGAFIVQLCWIVNYYAVNKSGFAKEVNGVFEDAVKKEFDLRCDTMEGLVFKKLLDTNEIVLSNVYDAKMKTTLFTIANKHQLTNVYRFHTDSFNVATTAGDTALKIKMAHSFAKWVRNNGLNTHIVWYYTQNLGEYIDKLTVKYDFDTVRLRHVFAHMLTDRDIHVPFAFYVRQLDSTTNASTFKPSVQKVYPIITRAFLTYKRSKSDHYVRAMFGSPRTYIVSRMGLIFAASVVLIVGIAFSLFYLFRSLTQEKRLSAIKNDFISNITHEFKTPIATVSAAIEALTSFDVLDDRERTQRYLSHSKKELGRLSALVDKVLNISVYEDQQFDIKPENLNVDDLIKAIITESTAMQQKQVTSNYVNTTGIATLWADKLYFQHTLSNVIDNAIKYSGQQVNIKVKCSEYTGFFVIAVADTGIGISATDLPYIFEKFYRVPAGNQHRVKGHGLGLSYVKSIIEKHKGWCKMDSKPGEGSTLFMAWPI